MNNKQIGWTIATVVFAGAATFFIIKAFRKGAVENKIRGIKNASFLQNVLSGVPLIGSTRIETKEELDSIDELKKGLKDTAPTDDAYFKSMKDRMLAQGKQRAKELGIKI